MTVSVCPVATVYAPIEAVWAVLREPGHYNEWWDAVTERIEPPGSAAPGQVVYATSRALGRRWPVETRVLEVDPERHSIDFITSLPLGIVGRNHLVCTALDAKTTRVTFG